MPFTNVDFLLTLWLEFRFYTVFLNVVATFPVSFDFVNSHVYIIMFGIVVPTISRFSVFTTAVDLIAVHRSVRFTVELCPRWYRLPLFGKNGLDPLLHVKLMRQSQPNTCGVSLRGAAG